MRKGFGGYFFDLLPLSWPLSPAAGSPAECMEAMLGACSGGRERVFIPTAELYFLSHLRLKGPLIRIKATILNTGKK